MLFVCRFSFFKNKNTARREKTKESPLDEKYPWNPIFLSFVSSFFAPAVVYIVKTKTTAYSQWNHCWHFFFALGRLFVVIYVRPEITLCAKLAIHSAVSTLGVHYYIFHQQNNVIAFTEQKKRIEKSSDSVVLRPKIDKKYKQN